MSLSFQKNLGSACHQRSQAQVPVCLVTTLKHDELLFAHVPVGAGDSTWVVQSMSCSVQRFWNASTATLKITTAAEDLNYFAPPFPSVINSLDNISHPLGPEDSICIWLGYTDELYKNPVDLIESMRGDRPSFIRVFVGIIDTIGVIGTDAGFNCTIQCRDRMRYMMETQVSLSPFDITNDRSYVNLSLGGTKKDVTRSETILRLAQLGIGHITEGKDPKDTVDVNGMRIERGDIKDLGLIVGARKAENKTGQGLSADLNNKTAMPPPNYFYAYGKKPLASKVSTTNLDIDSFPKFNIFTSRLPFSTESVAKEYTIEQQIPIELIKWLSNQEAYPTELFCNPQDGNYYYIPRSCDLSGLADSQRFYRTYFYRYQPPDLGNDLALDELAKKYPPIRIGSDPAGTEVDPTSPFRFTPDWAQGIINWREELTTNAMYTNYIIANNSPNSTRAGQVILMSMSVRPPFLSGRAIAGRNMYIIDETINDRQEALAVGLQMARIHSKETRAASMTLIGDPSMVPGEIVQVVGSPLHRELATLDPLINERRGIVEYLDRETQVYDDIITKTKNYAEGEEKGIAVNGANSVRNSQNTYTELPKGLGVCIGGNVAKVDAGGTPRTLRAITEKDRGCIFFNDKPTDTALPAQAPVLSGSETEKINPSSTGSILSGGNTSLNLDANADQSKMIYPLTKGFPVTSIVGQRWGRPHNGIDIGSPIGASVVASLGGKVIVAGVQDGYGNVIYLDHGNNFTSRYAHLSQIDVKINDNVQQGTVIGLSGNSGKSTGPHLHFELRSYNNVVKPTFMTFSAGSTPTAKQIADRIKAVGGAAIAPSAPSTTQAGPTSQAAVPPVTNSVSGSSTNYRNIIIVSRTQIKDLKYGLENLSVELYDKQGKVTFTGTVNSGKREVQVFGEKLNNISGSNAPLPYGKYKVGKEVSGANAAVGKYFIPITPTFTTNRSALGLHLDADRKTGPTTSGTIGCLGFITEGDFAEFRRAFKLAQADGLNTLEFISTPSSVSKKPSVVTRAPSPAPLETNPNGRAQEAPSGNYKSVAVLTVGKLVDNSFRRSTLFIYNERGVIVYKSPAGKVAAINLPIGKYYINDKETDLPGVTSFDLRPLFDGAPKNLSIGDGPMWTPPGASLELLDYLVFSPALKKAFKSGLTNLEVVNASDATAATKVSEVESNPTQPATSDTPANVPLAPAPAEVPTEYKVEKYETYPDEMWKKSHYNQEPQSLFRVDAVRHDFNAAGKALAYSIEVVLLPITG